MAGQSREELSRILQASLKIAEALERQAAQQRQAAARIAELLGKAA